MLSRLMAKYRFLLLILFLASYLRIVDINSNPKAMYGDSLTLVYDAYSILKTGKDQTGQFLPLFFSMGGGRPAGYIYATIPFVALFGPTAAAARAVSILSGIGIVLLLYLLGRKLFSEKIGIYAAFLAAIAPWELSISRGAFETHFALFLSLLGLYCFYKARENQLWWMVSAVSFALAMQTYLTYVVNISLFIGLLFWSEGFFKDRKKLINWKPILLVCLIAASLVFSIYTSASRGSKDRFSNIALFDRPEVQANISSKVAVKRAFSAVKPELAYRIHNKYTENLALIFENYTKNFGLEFLFLKGDQEPLHNPASMGELCWGMLPLIILGIIYLYLNQRKYLGLLVGWLLIAPIAGSLVSLPHALRNSFMLPPFLILAACGLEFIFDQKNKSTARKILIAIFIIFLIQLPFFIYNFYFLAPNLYANFWSYNAKKGVEIALKNSKKFDYIILSTSIPDMEFAYPVYAKVDPGQVISQFSKKTYLQEFSFVKYGKVYLGSIPSGNIKRIMGGLAGSVLYIGPVQDRGKVDSERIVRDKDGSAMFVISTKNLQGDLNY